MEKQTIHDPLPDDLHQLVVSSAQIQTHSLCNGRCVICPYRRTHRHLPQGKMEWELFKKIIDELVSIPTLRHIIPMLQNEPLLDERLPQAIAYIKNRCSDSFVTINTNGSLLTPSALQAIVDAGLDGLIFSLNALTKETFGLVQPGLSYDTVLSNLKYLITNRPKSLSVMVKAMIIKENVFELSLPEKFSDLPELFDCEGIPFRISAISNRAGSLDGYEEMLVFEHTHSSKKKLYCHDVFKNVFVLFNGDVINCCADWDRRSVVGNVREQTFHEVWDGRKARSRREAIAAGLYQEMDPCHRCSQALNIMKNHAQPTK